MNKGEPPPDGLGTAPPPVSPQRLAVPMTALPPGRGRYRTILFDACWRPIWDSATATTPAYQHVTSWVNAVIHHPDGTRWTGQLYCCPEGIKRWSFEDVKYLLLPPNPLVEAL